MARRPFLFFLIAWLLPLFGSCVTPPDGDDNLDGTNGCIISITPLEPKGGWLYMSTARRAKSYAVEISFSSVPANLEVFSYPGARPNPDAEPVPTPLFMGELLQGKFRAVIQPMTTTTYRVLVQEATGTGWGTLRTLEDQVYDTTGGIAEGTWKAQSASATEAIYLLGIEEGKNAGIQIKGPLQDLGLGS